MKYIALIAFITAPLVDGPFGFEKGLTRQQALNLVEPGAVSKQYPSDDRLLSLATVPKPHSAFESYPLLFSWRVGW
jgi:hypothetical protein